MPQPKKPAILVVDDSLTILHSLKIILSNAHYEVFITPSVVEAIEVLRQEKDKIQLIFLDILMPERDGFSFLNYLLKQHAYPIKVFALTAVKDAETQKKFFSYASPNLTTLEYIEKPFSKRHILQSVKNALNDASEQANANPNKQKPAKQKKSSPSPQPRPEPQQTNNTTHNEINRLEQKLDYLLNNKPTFLATLGQDLLRLLFIAVLLALALKFGLFENVIPLLTTHSS
ncbi:MAG: response regulator [Gammaproteobacteria bacterium]|nr:response regulator [Gammaproteobacteria bacterium]